jgi:hypothetical protein
MAVSAALAGTPKKRLLPPLPEDDSSRHRIPHWSKEAKEASRQGGLLREGHIVEESSPAPGDPARWTSRRWVEWGWWKMGFGISGSSTAFALAP